MSRQGEGRQGEYEDYGDEAEVSHLAWWKDTSPASEHKMCANEHKMNTEELEIKLEVLAEELIKEINRLNEFIKLFREVYEKLWQVYIRFEDIQYNEYKFNQMSNQITHLHNELRDVQKILGLDGSIPKYKPVRSEYD